MIGKQNKLQKNIERGGVGVKELDKMTFDEIKQYVRELEEFKQKMSSFSENDLRKLKILYVKKKIETSPFLKFSKLITID